MTCPDDGGGTTTVSVEGEVVYYRYDHTLSTDDNGVCWTVTVTPTGDPDDTRGFDDADAAAGNARTAYLRKFVVDTAGEIVEYFDAPPRCSHDPFESSPEDVALQAWKEIAVGPSPSVSVSPPDGHSVVGLPTFLIVDPYQPPNDVDASDTTITWDFGIVQLRATPAHLVDWDDTDVDPDVNDEPVWQATMGRDYQPGDEEGPPYGGAEPMAHIYQDTQEADITITTRWTGQWRIPGGPWEPLPAAPLFGSSDVTQDIREAQAIVTG